MSKEGHSIGEVAKILGVESHTVRFWSKELPQQISPKIGAGGRRYFTESDIERLRTIKELIHEKGYRLSMVKKYGFETQNNFDSSEILCIILNIEKQVSLLMQEL
jgi:DNA-binding transcriptional MerR regulator